MRDALKSLKEDESIMVLPADKGRASVVMDTDSHRAKMSTLIENGPYQLLSQDPTGRLTRKLSEKLLVLHTQITRLIKHKVVFIRKTPSTSFSLFFPTPFVVHELNKTCHALYTSRICFQLFIICK